MLRELGMWYNLETLVAVFTHFLIAQTISDWMGIDSGPMPYFTANRVGIRMFISNMAVPLSWSGIIAWFEYKYFHSSSSQYMHLESIWCLCLVAQSWYWILFGIIGVFRRFSSTQYGPSMLSTSTFNGKILYLRIAITLLLPSLVGMIIAAVSLHHYRNLSWYYSRFAWNVIAFILLFMPLSACLSWMVSPTSDINSRCCNFDQRMMTWICTIYPLLISGEIYYLLLAKETSSQYNEILCCITVPTTVRMMLPNVRSYVPIPSGPSNLHEQYYGLLKPSAFLVLFAVQHRHHLDNMDCTIQFTKLYAMTALSVSSVLDVVSLLFHCCILEYFSG
jgi:hypothetical protein